MGGSVCRKVCKDFSLMVLGNSLSNLDSPLACASVARASG